MNSFPLHHCCYDCCYGNLRLFHHSLFYMTTPSRGVISRHSVVLHCYSWVIRSCSMVLSFMFRLSLPNLHVSSTCDKRSCVGQPSFNWFGFFHVWQLHHQAGCCYHYQIQEQLCFNLHSVLVLKSV